MKVKSNVKAGKITTNHNQTVACASMIRSKRPAQQTTKQEQ